MFASTGLGKRSRSGREIGSTVPLAKRIKHERYGLDDDATPSSNSNTPHTPSKSTKTWVLSPARKPLTPRTPRTRDSRDFDRACAFQQSPSRKASPALTECGTPLAPAASRNLYNLGRQLFTPGSEPGCLVERGVEREQLERFLLRCQKPRPNGCLYITGPPGTGKSALVRETTEAATAHIQSVKRTYLNCMSVKSTGELYSLLLDSVRDDRRASKTSRTSKHVMSALTSMFVPRKKSATTFLVVLDEIDNVLALDENVRVLFELALHKSSQLLLIGIANTLDLTDRFLPRLKARRMKPEFLLFRPYNAAQISKIITTRLRSLLPPDDATSFVPLIHPAAIDLCSRKISTQSGDLRRAFEICRCAIDLLESRSRITLGDDAQEGRSPSRSMRAGDDNDGNRDSRNTLKTPKPKADPRPPDSQKLDELSVRNAPRVSLQQLNKITVAAFSVGAGDRVRSLNLQQKAALCSLAALENQKAGRGPSASSSASAPTVKELYQSYCRFCTEEDVLHPLSISEFREVLGSLEAASLVRTVESACSSRGGKRTAATEVASGAAFADGNTIASQVAWDDLSRNLSGPGCILLNRILGIK